MIGPGETRGMVFNIQHYSIHDGPGIRTTVFFKGCPLRCFWCQNPESQATRPELFFDTDKCKGCGSCVEACPEHAITLHDGRSWTNRDLCRGAGKCAEVCPNEARNLMGSEMSVDDVLKDVNADAIFYERSGGGVTLSGGEPLAQPGFAVEILRLSKQAGLHTTLDTSGCVPWDTVRDALQYVDLVLFDLKHMDSTAHKAGTGVPNATILQNAVKIRHELKIPLVARVPIVPGYNDSFDNISATARFVVEELDKSVRIHLLPYHRMGETKYERLERPGRAVAVDPPGEEHMAELHTLVESFGLTAVVGG